MTRDCRHSTGDDQRLRTVQEMTRDCGHSTGEMTADRQEMTRTADRVQEMTRDCGHSTGNDQRLWT
ncbi:unnamed protein product [Staurois parvus]|uniref:Uncharacterized protein n=1 Tax=Staurois parvus TaxID=386267 RepID=A0ABN9E0Q7_9NEOB|nr:unnamed protein product [Staurois parvus]